MNQNYQRRDEILKPFFNSQELGGCRHFRNLDQATLKLLIDEDFADPQEAFNNAPETKAFFDFLTDHPYFTCHGYAVSHNRDDYRITIEGIEFNGCVRSILTFDLIKPFIELVRYADELIVTEDRLYCWFD